MFSKIGLENILFTKSRVIQALPFLVWITLFLLKIALGGADPDTLPPPPPGGT